MASRGAVRPLLDSLPRPTTSFVGRGTERALVQALLERGRMVSLTGSPGCGKTRLAVEVARDVGVRYRDGVCFVALAEVGDPMLVPTAVASALHVREQPGRPLRVVLGDYLRPRRMLLILDGCERVADACARLAEDLLRRSGDLRILATSRGLLRVAREVGVDVLPLAIPDRDASSVDSALRAEAARLFRDRALATREDFHLTDDHATGLRQICRRLSGIPLAIELTAVRTRDVSIDEIASRLDEPFSPLGDLDPADVPAALTLRAAMDFTYGLLSESERMLLRRLSVFAGGFTAAAAAAVCACGELDAERIGALLPSLVDKFLVMPVPGPGATVERYRLLDTVRDYAARTLADRHETVRWAIRHLEFYREFAERAAPGILGADQIEWCARLEAEHGNIRAALTWSRGHPAATTDGLRLAGALWCFWFSRGHVAEGREWLESLLAAADDPGAPCVAYAFGAAAKLAWRQRDFDGASRLARHAEALARSSGDAAALELAWSTQSQLARDRGDLARAAELLDRCAELCGQLSDPWRRAIIAHYRGVLAAARRDYAEARRLYGEALTVFLGAGDRWGTALVLHRLARIAVVEHDDERAGALLRESLALFRMLGERWGAAYVLIDLGALAMRRDELGPAAAYLVESLAKMHEFRDPRGIAEALEALAHALAGARDAPRAATVLGTAAALRETLPHQRSEPAQQAYDELVARLHAALGEDAYAAAWVVGRQAAPDAVIGELVGAP